MCVGVGGCVCVGWGEVRCVEGGGGSSWATS